LVADFVFKGAEFTVSPPAVATAESDADCDKMVESTETEVGATTLRSDLQRIAAEGDEWNGGNWSSNADDIGLLPQVMPSPAVAATDDILECSGPSSTFEPEWGRSTGSALRLRS